MTDLGEWMENNPAAVDAAGDTAVVNVVGASVAVAVGALIDISADRLEAALQYAAIGWPVFPCSANKAPMVPGGFKSATTDPACIRAWWGVSFRGAAIGVACGAVEGGGAGIVVLDVDIKPEKGKFGDDTLSEMEEKHGLLPDTLEARTPSGGRHVVFLHPGGGVRVKSTVDMLGNGLDTRADGGYIIVEPSDGYGWEASSPAALAECPAWILDGVIRAGSGGAVAADSGVLGPLVPVVLDDAETGRIRAALDVLAGVPAVIDEYIPWLEIGMALHEGTGGSPAGFALFDKWSQLSEEDFPTDQAAPNSTRRKWASFGRRMEATVGLGTLFERARAHGWRDAVAVEREAAQAIQAATWTAAQAMTQVVDEGSVVVVERWRCAPIPCEGLEALRLWMMANGVGAVGATVGALMMGSAVAARRWETADGDSLNLWCGIVCADISEGRRVVELCEVALRAAGLSALVHQERVEGHVQVRKALWRAPACLFTADTLGGQSAGGQSAIRRKAEQAHSDLIRFGYHGRTIMLSPDGLQAVTGPGKENNRTAEIVRPAASVVTAIHRRSVPVVYRADAFGVGGIEVYLMAWSEGQCLGGAIVPPDDALAAAVASMGGRDAADEDELMCGGPEAIPPGRRVDVMGHPIDGSLFETASEAAGVQGADWCRGMEAAALRNARRVVGVLGACQPPGTAGMAGEDAIAWSARWCEHWYGVTVGEIVRVGGSSDGKLSLADSVLTFVTQAGAAGVSNRDLTMGCKPYRSATKEERAAALAQLSGDHLIRAVPGVGRQGKRWQVVPAMVGG